MHSLAWVVDPVTFRGRRGHFPHDGTDVNPRERRRRRVGPARTGAGRARNAAGGASRERSDGSRTPRDRPGQRPPLGTEATERRAGRDAPGRQPRRGANGASGRSRTPVAGRAKRGPPGRQPGRARALAARCRRVTGLGWPRSRCGACAGLRSVSGVAGARGTAAGSGVGHGAATARRLRQQAA